MRCVLVSLLVWLVPVAAIAQDGAEAREVPPAESEPATEATPAAEAAPTDEGTPATEGTPAAESEPAAEAAPASEPAPVPPAARPKVAVVIVGDADPVLVAAAVEMEAHLAVSGEVRLPADGALRAAMRGDTGVPDDGLDEVRRERRRLGLGEASDAPVLARLGRRAGAVLVIAIREGAAGAEAVALDVRSAQYFDGVLPLDAPDGERSQRFVTRRARVAARGTAVAAAEPAEAGGPAEPTVPPEATQATEEDGDEPDWFEQNWPYFAAGGLLAAAIVFVVVTATDGGDPPPVLRFQPPGAP